MRKAVLVLFFVSAMIVSCTKVKIEIKDKGIVLPDNVVIHYLEGGQGPVLVLVHGLGSSAEIWRPVMERLAKSYRVVAPDLPGYGKSDRPNADYSIEYQSQELGSFIDALGADKITLAGNSMGGWIAAITALNDPGRIGRLILVDSAGFRRDFPPPVNINPSTREEMRAFLLELFADKSRVSEGMVNGQWEYRKDIGSTVLATLESLKTKAPYLDDRLKEIKIPTLIVWGKQDAITPLDLAGRFNSGIRGSRLVVIDDAGHVPELERPEAFYRAVKSFVRDW